MGIKTRENLLGIFLILVVFLSIAGEFIYDKISQNYETEINYSGKLTHSYGDTNARYLEVISLLHRNLSANINGVWNVSLSKSGWFNIDSFDNFDNNEQEWGKWKDKPVSEFWKYQYYGAWEQLEKSQDKTNDLKNNPPDFSSQNKLYKKIMGAIRILQIIFVSLALYQHIKIMDIRKNR